MAQAESPFILFHLSLEVGDGRAYFMIASAIYENMFIGQQLERDTIEPSMFWRESGFRLEVTEFA